MEELIKVQQENNRITVLARDLHEFLEVETRFNDWFKRMSEYGFMENEDYIAITQKRVTAQGNETTYTDYQLTIEMAKEIAMIQRNEKGKQARQYFIQVEKEHKQGSLVMESLSPELRLLISMELKQKEQDKEITFIKERVESIRDVIAIDTTSWRDDTGKLLRRIGNDCGDNASYQEVRAESYHLLEKRMGVNLSQRLTNKRRRMADEGICKSKRDKLNCLDIIAEDKKLIEGYTAIVKEIAIKYGIA